jgi:hypothetical protein
MRTEVDRWNSHYRTSTETTHSSKHVKEDCNLAFAQ